MTSGCEGQLLRRLASMPFLDRLELAAFSGWSRGAVYAAVGRLDAAGLASSVSHATGLISSTRRYHLTADGLRCLAWEEGLPLDDLLRACPVSAQWRRMLLERLDAVAAIYRLAATVAHLAHRIRFRWYRAGPLDAAIAFPGGRIVGVVRQGRSSDRTAFAKRLWRLRDSPPLRPTPSLRRTRCGCATLAGWPQACPPSPSSPWSATPSAGTPRYPCGVRRPVRRSSTFGPLCLTRGRMQPGPPRSAPHAPPFPTI